MMTIQNILRRLAAEGHIADELTTDSAHQQAVHETLTAAESSDRASMPVYIQALTGISAWMAAVLLFGFVEMLLTNGGTDTGVNRFMLGSALCVGAVVLRRRLNRSIFLGQLALVGSLAGQHYFGGGMFLLIAFSETAAPGIGSSTTVALASIALEVAFIIFYPDFLRRLIATLLIGQHLLAVLAIQVMQNGADDLTHVLILALTIGTVTLWLRESTLATARLAPFSRPVGYGMATLLLVCCGISWFLPQVEHWWLAAGGLLLALLLLEYTILARFNLAWRGPATPLLLGGTALLLVPALQTPGILAALVVLLLGFERGNRILLGLAVAFLAVFLVDFYYNLEWSLLLKSLALLGTGLIIFALRYGILHRLPWQVSWLREEPKLC